MQSQQPGNRACCRHSTSSGQPTRVMANRHLRHPSLQQQQQQQHLGLLRIMAAPSAVCVRCGFSKGGGSGHCGFWRTVHLACSD
jgi:hypothetical protein